MPTTKKFSFSSREEEEGPAEEGQTEDWRSLSYRWMGGDRVLEARFGRRLASELDWAEAVEEGLPTEALEAVMKRSALSWKEIGELVIPRRTFSHRKEEEQSLSPEESDRLVRLLRVVAKAKDTFQNEEKAERWLKKENRALGGRTPLEALKTESGARLVENVLGRIAHGVYS